MDHDPSYVLLDLADDERAGFEASFLARNGHPVHVCPGPGGSTCPILVGTGCERFKSAHGVIFQLDLDRPAHRAILKKYRVLAGDGLPIRVVVEAGQDARYAGLLTDFEVWTHEPSVADLDGFAAEVEAAER
jgi:hypothetical protein